MKFRVCSKALFAIQFCILVFTENSLGSIIVIEKTRAICTSKRACLRLTLCETFKKYGEKYQHNNDKNYEALHFNFSL